RTEDQHEFRQQDKPDERADRHVAQKASPQRDKVDVEHHHDEQEQHGHSADIDDDQDHRQELGAQQHEQTGRVEEGEDQEQDGMHGVARADDHDTGGHGHGGEEVEGERLDDHA